MSLNITSPQIFQRKQEQIAKTAASADSDNKSARNVRQNLALKKAAQEFESQLLGSLWKSMQGSLKNEEDDSSDPAAGNIQDLQVQALCSGVAKNGGIGIAKMITEHLNVAGNSSQSNAVQQNHGFSGNGRYLKTASELKISQK